MKKFLKSFYRVLCVFFIILIPCVHTYAAGDTNMEGGDGGGFGNASSGYVWSGNREGVRVSIVRSADRQVIATIDLSNGNNSDVQRHFGKKSKLAYLSGSGLAAYSNSASTPYTWSTPSIALPPIIISARTGNTNNIAAIKEYFVSEDVLRFIAQKSGFPYETLTNGLYRLMIEPIAYAQVGGLLTAMTATEAAILNGITGNKLRVNMPSLSHQNLPLSIFLQRDDLGISKWTGAASGKQTDTHIIQYLGVGVIRFSNDVEDGSSSTLPPTEIPDAPVHNAEYRTSTTVYSTVVVRDTANKDHTPDNPDTPEIESPVTVTFKNGGTVLNTQQVYVPAGGDTIAWVKWTTPNTPGYVTIEVITTAGASASNIIAKIVTPEVNDPPDPEAEDRYDSFYRPMKLGSGNSNAGSKSWSLWKVYWHPGEPGSVTGGTRMNHWTNGSSGADIPVGQSGPGAGWWIQYEWLKDATYSPDTPGWWEFYKEYYSASANAVLTITANKWVPTATNGGKTMRSGYGFDAYIDVNISASGGEITQGQSAVMYFPEFNYATGFSGAPYPFNSVYWRWLVPYTGAGDVLPYQSTGDFRFKVNLWSTYKERVHFTPVWVPDGSYTPYVVLFDVWTPGGMIQIGLEDTIQIEASLFDDWHIAPRPVN